VSGLDLEIRWLATLEHPRLLTPSAAALRAAAKPAIAAAAALPVRQPDWVPLGAGEGDVHTFCRRHDWRVWLKGPAYESRPVRTWREVQSASRELGRRWGEDELFVQAHVAGQEASVAFAAYRGELLAAVFLDKLAHTSEGKVWAGMISDVPAPLL